MKDAAPPIDVSVLVNTYRRPRHLAIVLESIALTRATDVTIEIVVSDDGSADDTAQVVRDFAAHAPCPVRFTSQPHEGFRLARVRNEAARLARGAYLLFLDGDCAIPRHHVAAHLARRRRGTALLGFCARLPEATSRLLVPENLSFTSLADLVPDSERARLSRRHRKAWWHSALRHPTKPRLAGGDFGVWRDDFRRVNGFDERFVGWGQEDDDLGLRLRAAGVRLESILDRTFSLHIWHESDPTATPRWRDGPNVAYFERRGRLTACRHGLQERAAADVIWGLPDDVAATPLGRELLRHLAGARLAPPGADCEIDVVIRPGRATFTRPAECRLAIHAVEACPDSALNAAADQVLVVPDLPHLAAALDAAGTRPPPTST
jgi:glycosyltransferase involved in cell wall biosynthesis